MRFLLMGYGSIAKTLLSIINQLGEKWDITTCDIRDGVSGQEMIEKHHSDFDAVINLSYEITNPIRHLCGKYNLKYIDAGYEASIDKDYYTDFDETLDEKYENVALLGFGMNPGLVELIAKYYGPNKPYIALQFETDDASSDERKVFATWCPYTYFNEVEPKEYAYTILKRLDGSIDKILVKDKDRYNVRFSVDGKEQFGYNYVPHEEDLTITKYNVNCKGVAFLIHTPTDFQNYVMENFDKDAEFFEKIEVANKLHGTEEVGLIFYDGSENLRYVRNISSHDECYEKYKSNATCYQTASGVYLAMSLLPYLGNGIHTATSVAIEYKDLILKTLDKIGFKFDIVENYMDKREFEEKVLPLFGEAKEWFRK